eukprot:3961645-Heterocapsa_arctica.AAC.1
MAIVITLNTNNQLVFEMGNEHPLILQKPVTKENKRELLDQFAGHMDINTYFRVKEMGNCPE